jgi:hypothetical protein
MAYNHGVRVKEQATSLVAPVTGTAGLQVIIGTAPVNLAADPYKATNVPMIAYSFSEAVEQVDTVTISRITRSARAWTLASVFSISHRLS